MRRSIVLLLAFTAACSSETEHPANRAELDANEAVAAPAPPAEDVVAAPGQDRRSPEAAVAVLRDYVRLIGERKFVEGHRLWTGDDLSDGAFSERFSRFRTYRAEIGEPGRIEGAAGSSYIEIPITVAGTLASGEDFRQQGTVTLRRANEVPGATPEQLQWRIYRTDLRPREVPMSYRFVGRWASEERNCGDPWVFAASSLRTPAGSVCSFSQVREVPGGYDVSASCTAEGPAANDRLRLRFAESARALLFESRTIANAGLVRCP